MLVAKPDDILSEMKDVKSELLQVKERVGALLRKERRAEVQMEVVPRRPSQKEQEKDKVDDAEHESDLQ